MRKTVCRLSCSMTKHVKTVKSPVGQSDDEMQIVKIFLIFFNDSRASVCDVCVYVCAYCWHKLIVLWLIRNSFVSSFIGFVWIDNNNKKQKKWTRYKSALNIHFIPVVRIIVSQSVTNVSSGQRTQSRFYNYNLRQAHFCYVDLHMDKNKTLANCSSFLLFPKCTIFYRPQHT